MKPTIDLDTLADELYCKRAHWKPGVAVTGIHHDSRKIEKGDVFIALHGANFDGHRFIDEAIKNGACAVIAERKTGSQIPHLIVGDTRAVFSHAAELVYNFPTVGLSVLGVTGTNGKSTVSWIIHETLHSLGVRVSSLGTISNRALDKTKNSTLTTPEANEIQHFAREIVDDRGTHLVMEVSSHALSQSRADGVDFDVAIFTNLTQDHFDYHGTFERYEAAKKRLFFDLAPDFAVLNVDDPIGAKWAEELEKLNQSRVIRCSIEAHPDADFFIEKFQSTLSGIEATIRTPEGKFHFKDPLPQKLTLKSKLIGSHNLQNLLLSLAGIHALRLPHHFEDVLCAMEKVANVPGRLERIGDTQTSPVFVDYAHTPDGLKNVLSSLRSMTSQKLWVVFGCGGERDKKKRPLMGAEAGKWADICIVTSDNPRNENPEKIIDEILPGLSESNLSLIHANQLNQAEKGYLIEPDREKAIALACRYFSKGDTVLIAGKGHETYQLIGDKRLPFDDRAVAKQCLSKRQTASNVEAV